MSCGWTKPGRIRVSVTRFPAGPRILAAGPGHVHARVLSPSMARISSPARIPARAAGVSSTGETTTSDVASLGTTSSPSPPNSPEVSIFISLKTSGGMKTVCGSRVSSMPLMAP